MNDKTATVYGLPDCPLCDRVIEALEGHAIDKRLLAESLHDPRVYAQYITQGRAAPVVFLDDKPVNPKEIIKGSFAQ